MAQTLIARGQATITIQKDGYTITQSLGEYIFPADQSGKILSAVYNLSNPRRECVQQLYHRHNHQADGILIHFSQ